MVLSILQSMLPDFCFQTLFCIFRVSMFLSMTMVLMAFVFFLMLMLMLMMMLFLTASAQNVW